MTMKNEKFKKNSHEIYCGQPCKRQKMDHENHELAMIFFLKNEWQPCSYTLYILLNINKLYTHVLSKSSNKQKYSYFQKPGNN